MLKLLPFWYEVPPWFTEFYDSKGVQQFTLHAHDKPGAIKRHDKFMKKTKMWAMRSRKLKKNMKQTPRNKWRPVDLVHCFHLPLGEVVFFFVFPVAFGSEFRLSRHHWFTSGGLSQHQQNRSNDSHDGMMSDGKGRKQNINIYHHLHFLSWGEIALKCYVSFSSYWNVVWLHWVCIESVQVAL